VSEARHTPLPNPIASSDVRDAAGPGFVAHPNESSTPHETDCCLPPQRGENGALRTYSPLEGDK
jgi:hypothetical protein